jgi:hypothetical protein
MINIEIFEERYQEKILDLVELRRQVNAAIEAQGRKIRVTVEDYVEKLESTYGGEYKLYSRCDGRMNQINEQIATLQRMLKRYQG